MGTPAQLCSAIRRRCERGLENIQGLAIKLDVFRQMLLGVLCLAAHALAFTRIPISVVSNMNVSATVGADRVVLASHSPEPFALSGLLLYIRTLNGRFSDLQRRFNVADQAVNGSF